MSIRGGDDVSIRAKDAKASSGVGCGDASKGAGGRDVSRGAGGQDISSAVGDTTALAALSAPEGMSSATVAAEADVSSAGETVWTSVVGPSERATCHTAAPLCINAWLMATAIIMTKKGVSRRSSTKRSSAEYASATSGARAGVVDIGRGQERLAARGAAR